MLSVFLYEFRGETGFQCDLVNQLLIVERNAQFICHHSANCTAAATEFSTDGNDLLLHLGTSFDLR